MSNNIEFNLPVGTSDCLCNGNNVGLHIFSKLSPGELERLVCLSEECAEVIQAISKIVRHGYDCYNPKEQDGPSNRERLESELADVIGITSLLCLRGDIKQFEELNDAAGKKMQGVTTYLHHQ